LGLHQLAVLLGCTGSEIRCFKGSSWRKHGWIDMYIYIYYFNIYIYKYYYVYMICFLLSYIYDTLLDIWNNMMIFYDAIWSDTDMMIEFLSDNSDKSPLGGGEGTAYVHLTQCQKGMAPGQRISWPECIPWGKLT
jgi:hypothetical protein